MSDSNSPPLAASVRTRVGSALAARFGIDTRALALFRISLGLLLVVDLALRARHLEAFYTDAGVLPRSLLSELAPTLSQLSLHALSGDLWFQALLFLLAGLCGLALLVGYRTRLALFLSFLLLVSLHARNLWVLNGGDSVLRRLLFWSLFLPLGERWSVDALRRADAPKQRAERVATLASAALLIQVVLVYAVNAVFKLRGDLWLDGEAVRYVLSLEQFTILFADTVAQYPALLHAFDLLWLGLVIASPLLLVFSGHLRTVLVSLFAGMHLGMLLTMRIGIFPLISITALLVFLPSPVWDWLAARFSGPVAQVAERLGLDSRLDGVRRRSTPTTSLGSRLAALRRWTRRTAPAVVAVLLAAILVWNAMAVGLVSPPGGDDPVINPADNTWNMFAPHPPTADWWYVAPGELQSGERVDAYYLSSPVEERPETLEMYPSARWRKYMEGFRYGDDPLRRAFAGYLCSRWNRTHDEELTTVTLSYVEQPTRFDGPEPTTQRELLVYNCSSSG